MTPVEAPARDALLTHSRLACFRSCPRKHYIRYELGLRAETDGVALRVGSAFARAVEADAKGLDVEAAIADGLQDPYDLALVAAMFDGHKTRWQGQEIEHVAAELPFDIPLVNPATGAATPTWRLAGKIDRIVKLPDGRLALMEYKTTSRDFAPGADYWVRLHLDLQLSIYLIAARALGYDISTVLYDVTRRPLTSPAKATPVEERKYTLKATTLKDGTTKPAGSLYAGQRDRDETPEEFAARVAQTMAENPDRHYARIEIARLDQDLEEAAAELWQQQRSLREAQLADRWYRNPEACFGTFKCEYVGICQARDLAHQTPIGFRRVDDVHGELGREATDGGQPVHASAGSAAQFE